MTTRFQAYNRAMGRDSTYRSQEEDQVATALGTRGLPFTYEEHKLRYTKVSTYKTDFAVYLPDVGTVLLEVKGWWSAQDRQKIRAVVAHNPKANLVMVLSRPTNRISKQSKTTYAEFCDRHAIPWVSCKDLSDSTDPCRLLRQALSSAGITPAPDAAAQTEPAPIPTAMFSASSAPR